jgi:signal transduction histidine kinase
MTTILVVDDRAENREFLATLLGYCGYRVLEAADGEEALNVARREKPKLIITDVLMPQMDGYEFVRRLRADPNIAQTPVIFYTASYIEAESRTLAMACGVKHLIVKPSEPAVILRAVESALGSPAPAILPVPHEEFAHEHLRLITNKLSQQVNELERLNADLEKRVAARTAELSAANAELRRLNDMKDEFLAIVSHDLRSPLAGVMLAAELMAEQSSGLSLEERNSLLIHIVAVVKQQRALVDDLLELARNESGHPRLDLAEVFVSELAQKSIGILALSAATKQIAVDLSVEPAEQPVEGDSVKLLQVFNNLLTNAIKFTPSGGRITVAVEPEEDGVCVRVKDTGIGISADLLPGLFEKFKPHHRFGTAGEKGTGLGLAIVRQLTELHGGTIEVQSKPENGSIFSVHLPRRQKVESTTPQTGPAQAPPLIPH